MENEIRRFKIEKNGQQVAISLREDDLSWPIIVTEDQGELQRHEMGATHEEALEAALGPVIGRNAVKALRQSFE